MTKGEIVVTNGGDVFAVCMGGCKDPLGEKCYEMQYATLVDGVCAGVHRNIGYETQFREPTGAESERFKAALSRSRWEMKGGALSLKAIETAADLKSELIMFGKLNARLKEAVLRLM